jgi:cell volume regulation protein A
VGYAARWLLPRLALPAVGLYPIAAMALVVVAFGAASVLHVSGFMAVYVTAVLIGSAMRIPHRRSIIGFADGLAWISEIGLFVMLGLLADVHRLPSVIGIAVVAGLSLVLLARPMAAFVSLTPFRWPVRERIFVGIAGLRGAVPIVFAAIPLGLGLAGASEVFDATLIVVLVLLIVQTPFLPALARRLGLVQAGEADELDVESAPLDRMSAVVLAFDVRRGSGLVGVFVTELGLPTGSVVSLVIRDGQPLPIDDNTRFRADDSLLIVCPGEQRIATEERLRLVAKDGPMATWIEERTPVRRVEAPAASWPRQALTWVSGRVARGR